MRFQVVAVNGDGGTMLCQEGRSLCVFVFFYLFYFFLSAQLFAFTMFRY